jgi:excinuclease ABC subunit A
VGLSYLQLNRPVRSLSGGEAQRIRLAAQLGAHLSGVLYVLDEPTIGLHPTDTERLLEALDELQARGNGVLMVEHDAATLRSADLLVDMGPGAGVEGGRIMAQGSVAEVLAHPDSLTGRLLAQGTPRVRTEARPLEREAIIRLKGVVHHNLQGVSVSIPRQRLTVVTGVSGSGKSSLIHDALAMAITGEDHAGVFKSASGVTGLKRLVRVDDKPIGKNPRSTPTTYVGVWDDIRKLFARLPESLLRGYSASRFSFNVSGGRCATCAGQGEIKLEMSFLPGATTPCEACGGKRFNSQTTHVTYGGLSISDVLALSIREAREVFERVPRINRALTLLDEVGLGYLELGQRSTTLSGGEAQRIKLVSHLLGRTRADTVVVLDEPSIGLHMADLPKLMAIVHRLVDHGATVVIIEHNTDVLREADWVIDLGPGGGPEGGHVLYEGPVEGLKKAKKSRTAAWIRAHGL